MTADPTMIPKTIRPPAGRQTLLVSKDRIDDARNLGAVYDRTLRTWTVSEADAGKMPRSMLPTRDRPNLDPPYLKIALVPQTSWGRNVRSMMGRDEWAAFARTHVYASTGSVCRICGGRGEKWPVEADEVWRYDDAKSVQTLHAIIPLCPACHEVRSAGLATKNGRRRAIILHLSWVERITEAAAAKRIEEAMTQWSSRSRRSWTIDMTHMHKRYGIPITHDVATTDATNRRLIRDALARRDGNRAMTSRDVVRTMIGSAFR